jgi:hypothetical protein
MSDDLPSKPTLRPEHIRALRLGHGANCSSIGSVIDTLFMGALLGGAIFAAIAAAMTSEKITVVGRGAPPKADDEAKDSAKSDTGAAS